MAVRFIRHPGGMPLTSQAIHGAPGAPATVIAHSPMSGPSPMVGNAPPPQAQPQPAMHQMLPWLIMNMLSGAAAPQKEKSSSMETMPPMGKSSLPSKTYVKHALLPQLAGEAHSKAPAQEVVAPTKAVFTKHIAAPSSALPTSQPASATPMAPPQSAESEVISRAADTQGRGSSEPVQRHEALHVASALVRPGERMYQKKNQARYALKKRVGI